MKRGCPETILLEAFNKAWNKTQSELLISTPRKEGNKIRLITTYNQRNPPMKNIIKRHDTWLDKTKKEMKVQDMQTVYRKSRSLKQLLVKGKLNILTQTPGYSTNCNKLCITCPRMDTSNTVTSRSNTTYKIQGKFHCQTKFAVYVMECTICKIQYVGQTTQTINARIQIT